MLIPREYFTLKEVLADWGISESELAYVVEMGQLTLSVRVYGAFVVADRTDRPGRRSPDFEGIVDLGRRDAIRVLRKQECPVTSFALNSGTVTTPEGGANWVVYRDALLVRASEREKFEETAMVAGTPHANDYDRFLSFLFVFVLYREGLSGDILFLGLFCLIIAVLVLFFRDTSLAIEIFNFNIPSNNQSLPSLSSSILLLNSSTTIL